MAGKKSSPMISVIMGIYNCEDTVADAIDSILNQTYQDFELILCDDGSSDGTPAMAERYLAEYPDKIVLIRNDKNRGLNFTLNHCLEYARGKYVARMDGDDLSLPNRFETQVNFLESHPEIAILGASLRSFDENGVWGIRRFADYPQTRDFLHGNPFSHSVVMVRRQAYEAVGGYSEGKRLMRVEDYHLWVKMYSQGLRGANLQEELYLYRDDRNSYSKRKFRYRLNEAYVTGTAIRQLNLPVWSYVFALRPILVGLLPYPVYDFLHKRKINGGN